MYRIYCELELKSIEEIQQQAINWLSTYNNEKPNMALNDIMPK